MTAQLYKFPQRKRVTNPPPHTERSIVDFESAKAFDFAAYGKLIYCEKNRKLMTFRVTSSNYPKDQLFSIWVNDVELQLRDGDRINILTGEVVRDGK